MAITVLGADLVRKDIVVDENSEVERRVGITGICAEGRIPGQRG